MVRCTRVAGVASQPHHVLVIATLVTVLGIVGPGCIEEGADDGDQRTSTNRSETTEVTIETVHDPGLMDGSGAEEDGNRTPPEGAPASNGSVNVFLWTEEGFEQMDGNWSLWDPVAPRAASPGDRIAFPPDYNATFPLDEAGRTSFTLEAAEGTIVTAWVWGGTDADGTHGCDGRFSYLAPDEPPVVEETGGLAGLTVTVPFGAACDEDPG